MSYFAATGIAMSPAELLARVAHRIDGNHEVRTFASHRAAAVVATDTAAADGRWIVLGRPTNDPWGLPAEHPDLGEVMNALRRYGPTAVEMFAGPVLAIDLETSMAHRSLSGVIGWGPVPEDLRVWTTEGTAGFMAADIVSDSSPAFSLERLDDEVTARVGQLGPVVQLSGLSAAVPRGWTDAVRHTDMSDAAIVHPPKFAELLSHPSTARHLRDVVVPELARAAQRSGLWLHAPFLERPVIDQVGFGG